MLLTFAKSQLDWRVEGVALFARIEDVRLRCNSEALNFVRFVARDLGGGDPERMAAPKFAAYVKDLFQNTKVAVEIIDDVKVFEKEYPMFAAVNRAANGRDHTDDNLCLISFTRISNYFVLKLWQDIVEELFS